MTYETGSLPEERHPSTDTATPPTGTDAEGRQDHKGEKTLAIADDIGETEKQISKSHVPDSIPEGYSECLATVSGAWPTAPYNPHNWTRVWKLYHVSIPSVFGFICTFGSSVFTSGISGVIQEFNVSQVAAELGLSLYVLGLAFGPCIAAPMSEHLGRRAVYLSTFMASCLFTLGAGFSNTFAALMACRFFGGFFSGPVLAVGSGTIADVMPPADRGVGMACFAGSAFLGPIVAPIMAGFVVERKGWRWTMWLILFWSALGLFYLLPMVETHRPTILKREARKLARTAEKGRDISAKNKQAIASSFLSKESRAKGLAELRKILTLTLVRPVKMLFTEPILFFFSLYIAFAFGVFYGFFGAFPYVFQVIYEFPLDTSGLAWIGLLVGVFSGILIAIAFDYFVYKKRYYTARAKAVEDGRDPATVNIAAENRLYGAMTCCFGMPIALFWFGWTARSDILWISPIVASFFFGVGNFSVFFSGFSYLVDTYGPLLGASALAANGLARYIAACAFPLFTRQMYERLGVGWASSLFGFVSVALCAVPYVFFAFGKKLRERSGRSEVV